jgi:hypothetical protein
MSHVYCVPGCGGHLGKFEDCVTEALYGVTMDSGHDMETGNVDWKVWVAYLGYFGPGHPPYHVDAGWIGIPTGTYLVLTNDRGFVWSKHYATGSEARAEFDRIEAEYDEWDGRE